MAKAMYIGVSDKSRKVKKAYIGVDGKARKIKKMYIGVNNIARLFYSSSTKIQYLKEITGLSSARWYPSAASTASRAYFAGGSSDANFTPSNVVDFYNTSLSRTTATALSNSVLYGYKNAGVSFNGYAVFPGGNTGNFTPTNYICTYNDSGTKTDRTNLVSAAFDVASCATSTHVVIGGGRTSSYQTTNAVSAYNTSFTQSTPTALSFSGPRIGAANSNYMIFAGGINSSGESQKTVEYYNTSLTKSTGTSLSYARGGGCGIKVGKYVIFVMTGNDNNNYDIDVYDSSMTHTTTTKPPQNLSFCGYTSMPEHAIVCCGYNITAAYAWDESLTRTDASVKTAREGSAMACIGNNAIIGGGYLSGAPTSSVEVITAS